MTATAITISIRITSVTRELVELARDHTLYREIAPAEAVPKKDSGLLPHSSAVFYNRAL